VYVANHSGEVLDFLQKTNRWNDTKSPTEGQALSVILMDWEMPVMDGLVAVRIRQLQGDGMLEGHVPVIAVSANVRQQQNLDRHTRAAVAIHLPRYRGKCRPAQRVEPTSTSDLPRP